MAGAAMILPFALSPTLIGAAGAAVLVVGLGVAVKVQTSRLDSAKAETVAVQAKFDAFVAQAKAVGEQAQKDAEKKVAEAQQNADFAKGEFNEKLAALHKYYTVRLGAAGATAARVYNATRPNPDSGSVSAAGPDPGQPDGATPELVACRAGFDAIRADAAQDALSLGTLQDLLRKNGHPIR